MTTRGEPETDERGRVKKPGFDLIESGFHIEFGTPTRNSKIKCNSCDEVFEFDERNKYLTFDEVTEVHQCEHVIAWREQVAEDNKQEEIQRQIRELAAREAEEKRLNRYETVITTDGDKRKKVKTLERGEYVEIDGEWYEKDSELLSQHSIVWDHYNNEYCSECDTYYGYIDMDGNEGSFHCDGDYIEYNCEYYMNGHIARSRGIYQCTCGDWYDEDCGPCCDRDDESNHRLRCYHDSCYENKAQSSRFKIGFEIEKEDNSFEVDYEDLEKNGWTAESDSSLDDESGFEVISAILPLDDLKEVYKEIDDHAKYIDADYTSHAGGHIHLSDVRRSPEQLLDSIKAYEPFILAMYPSRRRNTYCEPKKFDDYKRKQRDALHLTDRTLEIRVFPSPRNTEALKFRANLCQFMLKNPKRSFPALAKLIEAKKGKFFDLLSVVYKPETIERKLALAEKLYRKKDVKSYKPQSKEGKKELEVERKAELEQKEREKKEALAQRERTRKEALKWKKKSEEGQEVYYNESLFEPSHGIQEMMERHEIENLGV